MRRVNKWEKKCAITGISTLICKPSLGKLSWIKLFSDKDCVRERVCVCERKSVVCERHARERMLYERKNVVLEETTLYWRYSQFSLVLFLFLFLIWFWFCFVFVFVVIFFLCGFFWCLFIAWVVCVVCVFSSGPRSPSPYPSVHTSLPPPFSNPPPPL